MNSTTSRLNQIAFRKRHYSWNMIVTIQQFFFLVIICFSFIACRNEVNGQRLFYGVILDNNCTTELANVKVVLLIQDYSDETNTIQLRIDSVLTDESGRFEFSVNSWDFYQTYALEVGQDGISLIQAISTEYNYYNIDVCLN